MVGEVPGRVPRRSTRIQLPLSGQESSSRSISCPDASRTEFCQSSPREARQSFLHLDSWAVEMQRIVTTRCHGQDLLIEWTFTDGFVIDVRPGERPRAHGPQR